MTVSLWPGPDPPMRGRRDAQPRRPETLHGGRDDALDPADRRPGDSPPGVSADQWAEGWIARHLRESGLDDVRLDAVPLRPATPVRSLRVGETEFEGFPLPYTRATEGTTAPLVRMDGGDVRGCLAVDELTLTELKEKTAVELATAAYDPEGVFEDLAQVLPLGSRGAEVAEPAIEAGAAGFVGALTGVPWETRDYYLPYDAVPRPIPALWLSPADSSRLLAMMDAGDRIGHLTVDALTEPVTSNNVVGTLRGASDHWVIVASHHDGPWASAVEDGSGIALVLAVARYFAALPVTERPHNLLFLLTAGHMAGAAGTRAFIERHRALLGDVVLEMHLEHAALRCVARDGRLVTTDDPEVRWWFTTQAPALERLVGRAIEKEGLRRSLVLPPDVFSPCPRRTAPFSIRRAFRSCTSCRRRCTSSTRPTRWTRWTRRRWSPSQERRSGSSTGPEG